MNMKGKVLLEYGAPFVSGAGLFFALLACEVMVPVASLLGASVAVAVYLGVSTPDEVARLQVQSEMVRRSLEAARTDLHHREAERAIGRLLETLAQVGNRVGDGKVEISLIRSLSLELELFEPLSLAAQKYVEYRKRSYPSSEQQQFMEHFPDAVVDFSNRLADRIDAAVGGSSKESALYVVAALEILEESAGSS
jgi:hypothetical protein